MAVAELWSGEPCLHKDVGWATAKRGDGREVAVVACKSCGEEFVSRSWAYHVIEAREFQIARMGDHVNELNVEVHELKSKGASR